MAARLPAQILSRQLRSQSCRRLFSSSASRLDAHNFFMPALSPTMTEGNIATWKLKEGDTFQPGDILLEIETDKATMDVEAQDAGVLVKIFQGDGEKGVQVGTRIAVIGDEGDDPKSLSIPADDSKPVAGSKEAEAPKEESKPEPTKPAPKKSASTPPSGPGQNKKYPLYPSVIALIHEHHIPESDVQKIPASGPNGRLLKGDVLAYLGSIDSGYPAAQSARIKELGHLDLSNIKLAAPSKPAAPEAAAAPPAPAAPATTSLSLPISLSAVLAAQKRIEDTIGVTVPLSTFLARATDLANDDLPRTKAALNSQDDLFNAVLGLDYLNSKTSRGSYFPEITALDLVSRPKSTKSAAKPDIIDILTGNVKATKSKSVSSFPTSFGSESAVNVFSLTVPKEEEKRARIFLERMKTVLQVEPGRLVL